MLCFLKPLATFCLYAQERHNERLSATMMMATAQGHCCSRRLMVFQVWGGGMCGVEQPGFLWNFCVCVVFEDYLQTCLMIGGGGMGGEPPFHLGYLS